ncbi:precorrin-2 dehydrogenase/sirohydrochlorin ferrochelatase family protein [Aquifex aeolicus]|uniref:precorrin-2 dehydrogenase n=1 Tax=Aquifex aeolicus (strain VF5) TaxID=224324 RepID=O67282_AQUAE|nr:bifunctional precorrin-2 dehydrogenase/sirohydrochlorin ferrochelatase [Aquifex aeolicus]AAC07241.1 siroheme synthase [Aquifex aeolicus VF5]
MSSYFPVYLDLKDKEVLVIGGGRVATRKVKTLLEFTKNITIVSPKVTEELKNLIKEKKIKWIDRKFKPSDLKDKFLVVVAVDDIKLQKRVFNLCEKRGILCNSVDSPKYCNFIFPSIIKRGDLVISISTSGKVPALSRALREKIEECLPENIEEIMKELEIIRKSEEKGEERQKKLLRLARELLKNF